MPGHQTHIGQALKSISLSRFPIFILYHTGTIHILYEHNPLNSEKKLIGVFFNSVCGLCLNKTNIEFVLLSTWTFHPSCS